MEVCGAEWSSMEQYGAVWSAMEKRGAMCRGVGWYEATL